MLKTFQARLQQYCELKTFRCTSWVSEKQKNQRSNCNIHWIMEKAREFRKKHLLH